MSYRKIFAALLVGFFGIAIAFAVQTIFPGAKFMVQVGSLILVGVVLFIVMQVDRDRDVGASDFAEWLSNISLWKILYLVSAGTGFMSLWILTNLYMSRNEPIFPQELSGPAFVTAGASVALFLLASWILNKRGE